MALGWTASILPVARRMRRAADAALL